MMLRQIVDYLREQIGKSERLARIAQHPFEELIEVAAPRGHEPRAPCRRAEGPSAVTSALVPLAVRLYRVRSRDPSLEVKSSAAPTPWSKRWEYAPRSS